MIEHSICICLKAKQSNPLDGIEKLSISCHISKQRCQSSVIAVLQCERVSPKGTQEGEKYL